MNNRNPNQESSNTVKAYFYFPSVFSVKRIDEIVEYYIPNNEKNKKSIGFNQDGIGWLSEPRNGANKDFVGYMSPLHAVNIPADLVTSLYKMLGDNDSYSLRHTNSDDNFINNSKSCTEEFKNLLEISKTYYKYVQIATMTYSMGSIEYQLPDEFDAAYKAYGNQALVDVFKIYILDGKLPKNKMLSDLVKIYNQLDEKEQESIRECITFNLLQTHASCGFNQDTRKAPLIDQTKKLPRQATNKVDHAAKIVGAVSLGGAVATESPYALIPGMLAALSMFAARKYDDYQQPYFIKDRHKRKDELLQLIEPKKNNTFKL